MRKFLILSAFILLFTLVSCSHAHTFSEKWNTDDTHHWHSATCEHTEEISMKGEHEWESKTTQEVSCLTDGELIHTCKVCGKSETETIKAIGHSWSEATCETPKTCSNCGTTEGEALGHSWKEADFDNPKTCGTCGATEGEPLEKPVMNFEFPNLTNFKTPNVYASADINKWEYQATVEENIAYLYVVQYFNSAKVVSDTVDLTKNHVMITTDYCNFILCSNGAFETTNLDGIVSAEYFVDTTTKTKTEYFLKVTLKNNHEGDLAVKFYSFDSVNKTKYSNNDVVMIKNGTYYHSHSMEKLYVGEKIKMKSESLYHTPIADQSPLPEKWGYHMQSAKEGLYIYVYQNVSKVVQNNDKWGGGTHIEFSIFHHSFGFGAQTGGLAETYVAVWPDKTYYINNQKNVYGLDTESIVVSDDRVEYRLFIKFDNNLENPNDGPYAFVRVRTFDPTDEGKPYSENDVVEYRDNRFLHTIKGDSVFVYEKITHIDNPYETSYLNIRLNKWNQEGLANCEDMTLFIGDSFFEVDNWWKNFYTDYQGKGCFTSAIGGTKVTQWLNWIPSLVAPFAANVKNIVIHLGYNDVNSSQVKAAQLEVHLEDLFTRIHEAYPDANIYYFGIGTSYWFLSSNNTRAKETDNLTKAYANTCSYLTFIDMDLCYKAYMDETGGTLESFFKDGTHPKNENYKYLINALENAGCVIANK